jgi:hypothetical protein
MELAGTAPGAQYDRLVVAGSASLAGTLDVDLLDGFAPAAGNSFEIISAAGGVLGTFNNELLPALAPNLEWNVLYGSNTVTLQVSAPGLPGDYNDDGSVDAADYVVWRKNEGTTNALPNDPIGGTIGPAQFNQWRANFGAMAGSGSVAPDSVSGTVPEPNCLPMLLAGGMLLGVAAWSRRDRSQVVRCSRFDRSI